ncbi:MAG TPA: M28 family peptidase [Ferruginibacter sp.]|mgnify:CR=1 FL=1|nr:M28 family peptidase [Ferruginibacter sp.]HPH91223.1 M28 family peptidase [Ferruginibacter sp.]
MKKTIVSISVSFLFCTAIAQKDVSEKYAAHITGDGLKKHLVIIAGEEMEGRETGTEGQRKAAAYIEAQYKAIGLQQVPALKGYQQFFPLFEDSTDVTSGSLKIDNTDLTYGEHYYVNVMGNSTKTITANSFVFAGYGISEKNYDDYKGIDVKGKVAVIFLGEPRKDGIYLVSGTNSYSKYTYPGASAKIKTATEKGAAAVIFINPSAPNISSALTNANKKSKLYFPPSGDKEQVNYLVASHSVLKTFFAEWNTDGLLQSAKAAAAFNPVELPEKKTAFQFTFKKERLVVNASNVIGVIEGTDKKEEYVFLTAHYDHLGKKGDKIYYGADDDGSGTCGVIAMAEAFAKAKAEGHGPRRTIVFMTVSGEEKGLWGSEYYTDNPVFPLDKTTVDLNIDMVGRVDTEREKADTLNYLYVVGHDKLSSELPVINEGVNKKYTGLTLDYKFDDPNDRERIYYRSDHYNFARKGVPVLFFYDGMLKADYHKPTDTVDKIYWDLYQKRMRLIFHTAWEMANRDAMLKRDIALPSEE